MRHLLLLIVTATVATGGHANEPVSTHGTWAVYREDPGICYGRGSATSLDSAVPAREAAYVQVTMFPMMNFKDGVFIIPGYSYASNGPVMVQVDGGENFTFSEDNFKATASKTDQGRLVMLMRSGNRVSVTGQAKSGAQTFDTFSLENFNEAYEQIAKLCDVEIVQIPEMPASPSIEKNKTAEYTEINLSADLKSAELGDTDAWLRLADAYINGWGTDVDMSQGYDYLVLAANSENAEAQFKLGSLYREGVIVEKDIQKAIDYWVRAGGAGGDPTAQHSMGALYETGEGVSKDPGKAMTWYSMAAKQHYAKSENNIGMMYFDGRGASRDHEVALRWFKRAYLHQRDDFADSGSPELNMGLVYAHAKDYANAYVWWTRSATKGNIKAQQNLKTLRERIGYTP